MATHVDPKKVKHAIKALRKVANKYQLKKAKKLLIEEDNSDENLYVQLTLKKIPYDISSRLVKIDLPHSLVSESADVCLFVRDLDRKNPRAENEKTVDHYRTLLREAGLTRNIDIIPLRQLRTEYQPFEAKRNLCAGYDVFLADQLIYPIVVRTLGKTFFEKNKLPRKVDMAKNNLRSHVEHVLCTTYLMLRCQGTVSTVLAAHLRMRDVAVCENVRAVCGALGKKVAGGWDNLLSLHLKTPKSVALPVYMSFGSRNRVFVDARPRSREHVEDNLSTVPCGRVRVSLLEGKVTLEPDGQECCEESQGTFASLMAAQKEADRREMLSAQQRDISRKLLVHAAFKNAKLKRLQRASTGSK